MKKLAIMGIFLAVVVLLVACTGAQGAEGQVGPAGPPGPEGPQGPPGAKFGISSLCAPCSGNISYTGPRDLPAARDERMGGR